jgi:cysteine synthase A
MKQYGSVLKLIGNTPMVKLEKITEGLPFEVYVKLEYMNPSGSLKDRIAIEMIRQAEKKGDLKKGYTIIEASTGNTGTALSMVGTRLGYKVDIYMPKGMTPERKQIMESYGATVHEVELQQSDEGSVAGAEVEIDTRQRCLELERNYEKIWWARQFSNPANVEAHTKTGKEIFQQMENRIDTLYGVAKSLKEANPGVYIVGAEPASAKYPISEGYCKVPGASEEVTGGIIEEMMESRIIDKVVKVGNKEAIEMSDRLVREEGLFCGISSGANVYQALKIGMELGGGTRIATVLPDSRDRYLSKKFYTT